MPAMMRRKQKSAIIFKPWIIPYSKFPSGIMRIARENHWASDRVVANYVRSFVDVVIHIWITQKLFVWSKDMKRIEAATVFGRFIGISKIMTREPLSDAHAFHTQIDELLVNLPILLLKSSKPFKRRFFTTRPGVPKVREADLFMKLCKSIHVIHIRMTQDEPEKPPKTEVFYVINWIGRPLTHSIVSSTITFIQKSCSANFHCGSLLAALKIPVADINSGQAP